MGGGGGDSSSTQELQPLQQRALDLLSNEIGRAAKATPAGAFVQPLTFGTRRGIDILREESPAQDIVQQNLQGGLNPALVQSIVDPVSQAVGDRFSQAGRSGSPAEQQTLARTLTNQLAPFAFQAQQAGIGQANQLQRQQAEDFLRTGDIFEQQQRAVDLAPIERLRALTGPGAALLSGAPMTQTQATNRNRAAGALGGALSGAATGASIGSVVPVFGTTAGAIGGGLLGAIGGGM